MAYCTDFATWYEPLGWGEYSRTVARYLFPELKSRGACGLRHLDLACGTGLLMIFSHQFGHFPEGLDLSESMLRVAAQNFESEHLDLPVRLGDMRDFSTEHDFDLITLFFDAINHLRSPEEWQAVFRSVRTALVSGGMFIFDFNTSAGLQQWDVTGQATRVDNAVIIRDGIFRDQDGEADGFAEITVEFFVPAGGPRALRSDSGNAVSSYVRFEETIQEWSYPRTMIDAWLTDAGFESIEPFLLSAGKSAYELDRQDRIMYLCR